jgi:phosphatidylserine/phosphatidylglycerophosphate/cardiolipin synthase-like enzyme
VKTGAIVLTILGVGGLMAFGVLVVNGVVKVPAIASIRSAVTTGGDAGAIADGQYSIYYSPSHNLEREDARVIRSAKRSIDAALYSATDWELCGALADAASRGVRVRVYRDREQFAEEDKRARGRETCSAQLVAAGAQVRVKSSSVLMHLKSYEVDGRLLRTGSANASPSGEKQQDNDVVFVGSAAAAKGFESQFAMMWARSDNETVTR